ncbi:MAG TPA: hypothetical protein VFP79_03835, partial [Pseudolabrys sp.]|nr:hypothetical protein [Pseudolabrys sp.]
ELEGSLIEKIREGKMDRFLQDQNVVLYRRLRNSSTGEVERRTIITLLRGEMAKLKISKDEYQQDKLDKSVRRHKQTRRNVTRHAS